MRGELDDALARMARREELLRRRSGAPTEGDRPPVDAPRPAAESNHPPADSGRYPVEGNRYQAEPTRSPNAGLRPPAETIRSSTENLRSAGESVRPPVPAQRTPVDDVADAVRRVVAHHPGLTVRLSMEQGTSHAAIRVGWSEGRVTVVPADEPVAPAPVPAPAPPTWPLPVQPMPGWAAAPGESSVDSAARLAELIRRDPSLLGGSDEQ
ncbi:hypothetical protein [Micromonospora sp. NPDC004704]